MVIWKSELSRGILYFVRPAFKFLEYVTVGTFQDIITAKKEAGYNIDVVRRYNKVLSRFAEYLRQQQLAPYADEVETVRDILCTMIDQELYFTPRWHNVLLKIAKEEGLLERTFEPE